MSTQHRDTKILSTKLDRIEERSRRDPSAVFNNIGHTIDLDLLRRCFHSLDGRKAIGIDRMTKEQYGKDLETNLSNLLLSIRRGSYHPKASRIIEIPKADGSRRPLAISCFEDKIVQEAVRRVMEKVFEPGFLDCSHGFRPNRGCDSALVALDRLIYSKKFGALLEIDLKQYFNSIPHELLIRMLKHRISDSRFIRLAIKLLKAPILDEQGTSRKSEIGSPQGSILSPLVANVFLHFVMDLWFRQTNHRHFGGNAGMVRYADDAVFLFKTLKEAQDFQVRLEERLRNFGIAMNLTKTKVIVCGAKEAALRGKNGNKMPTFTFLGFMHVWDRSFNKKDKVWFWRVKRRTCPLRFRKKLSEILTFIKRNRHDKLLVLKVKRIVQGYVNYFAVNDNLKRVSQFLREVEKMLFKWLSRRSQKRSYRWDQFSRVLERINFPRRPKVRNLFYSSKSTGLGPVVCR